MQVNQKHIGAQNIIYYDAIAANYDAILDNPENNSVRKKVADEFIANVKQGVVLDFGGGTGEDLNWLLTNNYKVIFCEPSLGMRNVAMEKFPNEAIRFLDDGKTDFTNWSKSLPFTEKVDAVIANFAVLNCIMDIDVFFKNLTLVTTPSVDIFLLVLDYDWKRRFSMNSFEALKWLFGNKPMPIKIESDGQQQLVYLHSVKSIQEASAEYFELRSCERLKKEHFSLIHLRRK
jgi:SAM-dependent methyltransferase